MTDDDAVATLVDHEEPWAVVQSAGYMNAGLVEDVPVEDARHQLDVMLLAPARMTQLVLPGMQRRGGSRVVVISSPLGEANLPFQGWRTAGACKRALGALTDTLPRRGGRRHRGRSPDRAGCRRHTAVGQGSRRARQPAPPSAQIPDRYDRAIVLLDEVRSRAADPAEVAATVGEALHAAHPRYRYRTPTGALPFALGARFVPTSVRARWLRPSSTL